MIHAWVKAGLRNQETSITARRTDMTRVDNQHVCRNSQAKFPHKVREE